ncbi:MAG: fibronectin type III domain-containing protein [Deltaproteobacteria bacterium]|nr:fibronectin type III domain-containing protein [Deltaproteobacteria bacterium]
MGLIMRQILFSFIVILSTISISFAGWQGPSEVVNGSWGSGLEQFGYVDSDGIMDMTPSLTVVLIDDSLIIDDIAKKRRLVYGSNGLLNKEVPRVISSGKNPDYKKYNFNDVVGFSSSGNTWIEAGDYYLLSPTGEEIETHSERPLQLGHIKSSKNGVNIIEYDDGIYTYKLTGGSQGLIRDLKGFLYPITRANNDPHWQVYKFDRCGKQIGLLDLPSDDIVEEGGDTVPPPPTPTVIVNAEYGKPVLSPNGDVYSGKVTESSFSILKWTWLDEATDPKGGPDTPVDVQALPSTSGVYLTWNPSPQDPGCVTGYDIERATSATGVFSNVTTVPLDEKQTYSYNDTSATAGATWYYRISAKSGIGNSDPVEVNATRP